MQKPTKEFPIILVLTNHYISLTRPRGINKKRTTMLYMIKYFISLFVSKQSSKSKTKMTEYVIIYINLPKTEKNWENRRPILPSVFSTISS